MNEHSSFVETWSAYILYDLPWRDEHSESQDVFEGQWSRLRLVVASAPRLDWNLSRLWSQPYQRAH
jgi:hypothetical protein